MELRVDETRLCRDGTTGVYVRAMSGTKWGSYDIACLGKESLFTWLRSHGGENAWAESVVMLLLGHTPDLPVEYNPK